ncbi:hypothetical protein KI387_008275, partial [Taxus chinensis]
PALQMAQRMIIIVMRGAQMEEHMEEVFTEDFMVVVISAEDKVSSHKELVIIVDLKNITN